MPTFDESVRSWIDEDEDLAEYLAYVAETGDYDGFEWAYACNHMDAASICAFIENN